MTRRILMLVENQPFPSDRRVNMEAGSLRDAGYDVTVVSPTSPRSPEREVVLDGVRVLRFACPPQGNGPAGFALEYAVAAVRMAAILRRLHREAPFDAVAICNPPDFLIQLARPFAWRGAGLIFDYHDPAPELFEVMYGGRGILHRTLLGMERWAFRTADVVMTVNDQCAEIVRGRGGVPAERVHVVRNCPDPGRFYPVEPNPSLRHGREHLVLWIGMMARKESLHIIVDAAAELVGRRDVAFAIVGPAGAGAREELAAVIERRGLQDSVHLGREVDDAGLREYLSTADVCLSVDPRNGLNDLSTMIKVLEYMTMGRAVVQFPLLEMQRVCGDSTLYAADADAQDLAAKIALLLDDPELRDLLGRRARDRIASGMTWQHEVPTLLAAVEQAITIGDRRARQARSATLRRARELRIVHAPAASPSATAAAPPTEDGTPTATSAATAPKVTAA